MIMVAGHDAEVPMEDFEGWRVHWPNIEMLT